MPFLHIRYIFFLFLLRGVDKAGPEKDTIYIIQTFKSDRENEGKKGDGGGSECAVVLHAGYPINHISSRKISCSH